MVEIVWYIFPRKMIPSCLGRKIYWSWASFWWPVSSMSLWSIVRGKGLFRQNWRPLDGMFDGSHQNSTNFIKAFGMSPSTNVCHHVSSISVNHLHIKFVFHSIRTHPEGFQSWHPILRCSRFIEDTSHVLPPVPCGCHPMDGLNGHPFWCFFGAQECLQLQRALMDLQSSMPSIEPQFSCNSLGTV